MDAFEKNREDAPLALTDRELIVAAHFFRAGMRAAADIVNDARGEPYGNDLRQLRNRILSEADK